MSPDEVVTLPPAWHEHEQELLDACYERWEAARTHGRDPSPTELCPGAPVEFLQKLADGIECLKQFDREFGATPDAAPADNVTRLGGYEVLNEIGRGGQGRVILARDDLLSRQVVIKILRQNWSWSQAAGARLEQEAKITGNLEHPGVIPVYGLGRDGQGSPYYVMRYVQTERTLLRAIAEVHQMAEGPERVVAYRRLVQDFVAVCRTIEYAHSKDVLHRDLKPANILVGDYGEVFVMDWGIAKPLAALESLSAAASMCDVNEVRTIGPMGTPAYMSPEQATNAATVGKASDIYGLGAMFFHLLVGEPPFVNDLNDQPMEVAQCAGELLDRVKAGRFRMPRQISPAIAPALEAICLKAMALRAEDRYATAGALADDVEHWLADEAVTVYADPPLEVARRWARRHRTLVGSAAAAVLVAVVALAGVAGVLTKYNNDLLVAKREADNAKSAAQTAEKAERQRATELEKTLYVNQLMLASSAWRDARRHRTRSVLAATKPELRSIEWNYAWRLSDSPPRLLYYQARPLEQQSIVQLQSSLNDKWLMTRQFGSMPGGNRLQSTTHVVSATDGVPKLGAGQGFLAFSPDGTQVLRQERVGENEESKQYRLALIDLATLKPVWTTEPQEDKSYNLRAAAFVAPEVTQTRELLSSGSPADAAGPQLVVMTDPWSTLSSSEQVRIARFEFREVRTGKLVKTIDGDGVGVSTVAQFSPDGRRLALCSSAPHVHEVTVLSPQTGKKLYALVGHTGRINEVVFSDDSRLVATASADGSVRAWESEAGRALGAFWGTQGPVFAAALNVKGDRIAGAGKDGGLRLWKTSSGKLLRTLAVNDEEVFALTFHSDGNVLLVGGTDGVVYRFALNDLAAGKAFRKLDDFVSAIRLAPHGEAMASVVRGTTNAVQVFDRRSGRLKFPIALDDPKHASGALYVGDAAFSPNGETLAVGGDNFVCLVDAASGLERWRSGGAQGPIAFTPDGKHVVAVRNTRDLIDVIRTENLSDQIQGEPRRVVAGVIKGNTAIYSGPQGDGLLVDALRREKANEPLIAAIKDKARGALVVLSAASGQVEKRLDFTVDDIVRLAMHPSQPIIAVRRNGTIELWNVETGRPIKTLKVRQPLIWRLAFSPDGDRLAVLGANENTASIIDVASGRSVGELTGSLAPLQDVVFSPDGRRVASCAADGIVRLWDAESASQLWSIEPMSLGLYGIAISRDGRDLVACGGNPAAARSGEIFVWDISPPMGGTP